jgi:hypothetical protein
MPMTGGHRGLDAGSAELEKLAAELDGGAFEARVVAHPNRRPFVYVRNRRASVLTENIYAAEGWFWWGWAERIASTADVSAAAEAITRVLRAAGTTR